MGRKTYAHLQVCERSVILSFIFHFFLTSSSIYLTSEQWCNIGLRHPLVVANLQVAPPLDHLSIWQPLPSSTIPFFLPAFIIFALHFFCASGAFLVASIIYFVRRPSVTWDFAPPPKTVPPPCRAGSAGPIVTLLPLFPVPLYKAFLWDHIFIPIQSRCVKVYRMIMEAYKINHLYSKYISG